MFSEKINIFNLCKEYLALNCYSSGLREKENALAPFTVYLTKDENNNYSLSDNEFSIKCILKEEAVSNFLSANLDKNQIETLSSKNNL